MFGLGKKERDNVAPVVTQGAASEAPFRMEFAPGLVLIEAEIRDRRKLAAFVAALNAISALLPEDEDRPAVQEAPAPTPTPAITAQVDVQPYPPPSLTPTRTIDLTRDPPTNEPTTFAPATSPTPGPVGEKLTAPPPPPAASP